MRDLMREVVNTLYMFFVRPQSFHWDRPKIDKVMMRHVKEYARVRREG